jgi:hypothetical protein
MVTKVNWNLKQKSHRLLLATGVVIFLLTLITIAMYNVYSFESVTNVDGERIATTEFFISKDGNLEDNLNHLEDWFEDIDEANSFIKKQK